MSVFFRVRYRLFVAWNIHWVALLPIFVFWLLLFFWGPVLSVLFQSTSFAFFNVVYCFCVDASMLTSLLASPRLTFLPAYRLSTSVLGCKISCIIMTFLVLWSICLYSSLVHFENGPQDNPGVYSFLMRFLLHSLVSCGYLIRVKYYSFIFSFITTCLMAPASKIPLYL